MLRRLESSEAEVQKLKLESLKRDIALGMEQLENGEYSEYDDNSLPDLLQSIKERGRRRLNQY